MSKRSVSQLSEAEGRLCFCLSVTSSTRVDQHITLISRKKQHATWHAAIHVVIYPFIPNVVSGTVFCVVTSSFLNTVICLFDVSHVPRPVRLQGFSHFVS